jgi:DnaK suppressor protein
MDIIRTDRTMDLPTQTHLATLRELLNYRLRELRAEVHAADRAREEASALALHEVTDRKDEATQYQQTGIDEVQAKRDRDEMAEVELALQRLDAGTYGDCADCGDPIALQRLMVLPAARRCAACQSAREQAAARAAAA